MLNRFVANEKIVDSTEIDKMFPTVISNTDIKTTNTIAHGMLFKFFPTWVLQYPVKNTSDLFSGSLRAIVAEVRVDRNVMSDKLTSCCANVDDADDIFRVWNNFTIDGKFLNWKALV